MINESDGPQDGKEDQDDQNVEDSPVDPMFSQFEGLIGGAIEKAVSQYGALLRQGLETEVKRIVSEFDDATTDVDQVVARRTRARLSELIEGEVRGVFEDTLEEGAETLADPIWRKARDSHIPYLAAKKSDEEAHRSQTPTPADSAAQDSVAQTEAPESEREDSEGPKSIAAPSPNFWVFPSDQQMRIRVQEEPDQDHPSNDAIADPQQPPADEDQMYGDALSAVVNDNSDLETVVHDNNNLVHIAPNETLEQVSEDDFDMGPPSEIDDEELVVADALEFDDFEEPEWDLPDSPTGLVEDRNTSDISSSEEIETVEDTATESDEESPEEEEFAPEEEALDEVSEEGHAELAEVVQEEAAAEYQAEVLQTPESAVDIEEEESLPEEETVDEVSEEGHTELAEVVQGEAAAEYQAEAVEVPKPVVDIAEEQAEVVAGLAEAPTLIVEEPDKVISDVQEDVKTFAEQGQELIANEPPVVETSSYEPSEPEDEQTVEFEGTVRLNVEAPGCVREIVQFVRELRQKPQLRLLRLVGNNREGVDIWLGLREPLKLGNILPEMEGVTIISKSLEHVGGEDERLLSVRLIRNEAPKNSEVFLPTDSSLVENPKVVA